MKQDNDKLTRVLSGQGRLKMPFPDFEDSVMQRISVKEAEKSTIRSSVFISWFFFIVGALCGLAAAIIIPMFEISLFGLEFGYVSILLQVALFIVIATQFDSLLTYTKKLRLLQK